MIRPFNDMLQQYGFIYLFAIYPVLSLFANNANEVQFYDLLPPLAFLLLATFVVHGTLLVIFRNSQTANILVILINGFVFYYALVFEIIRGAAMLQFLNIVGGRSFIIYYSASFIAGAIVIIVLPNSTLKKTEFIGKRVAVVLILVTLTFLFWNKFSSWDFGSIEETKSAAKTTVVPKSRPDIYHIVLDGYGRHDYLKNFYDYDNSEFIEWLESHGFFVAHQSRSNYAFTKYSLASFLNFQYLDDIPIERDWSFFNMIQNNKAMKFLKAMGYNIVTFETGQTSFDIKKLATHFVSMPYVLSEFQNMILNLTIFPTLLKSAVFQSSLHRKTILHVFDKLSHPFAEPSPKLVYAHIRVPHPPYVFDAQGNSLTPEKLELRPDLDPDIYKQQLADQTRFTTMRIQKIVERILEYTEGTAAILLHSDHGPAFTAYPGMKTEERFAILNAVYLPSRNYEGFEPTMTPVNIYRIVFNNLFQSDFPILKNSSYRLTEHGWEAIGGDCAK